jgi:carbon-monoxide dehydrogenase large subunit
MVMGQPSRIVGASVKRKEDPRLITGEGKFTDDVQLPGMTYMSVLRSPHASARILNIDTSRAEQHPRVLAVMTGEECRLLCQAPLPVAAPFPNMKYVDRYPLATDRVVFVGEVVAAVVATDRNTARDAVELIDVQYEATSPAVDMEGSAAVDSDLVHPELGTNICYEHVGTAGDPDTAFAEADGVVSAKMSQPRLVAVPMEGRAVVANYERAEGKMTLWVGTQSPHLERTFISNIIGVPENKVRVIVIDMGGGFGVKMNSYPENALACLLSMKLRRPVKWIEERSEHFIATAHGRGQSQYVEAAYKNDGTLVALRLRMYADLGAYCQVVSHMIPTLTPVMAPGVYGVQNFAWEAYGVLTNKIPYDAYRGAGRPEAAYIIERVMDLIAQKLDMEPTEIRRKNFIPTESFPYVTPTHMPYDSANYPEALDKALEIAGYSELRAEKERVRQQGGLMGVGVTVTTEICGMGPAFVMGGLGGFESAVVRFHPSGKVSVLTGASPHGQGEETSFAQLASDDLGVPFDDIEVIHGDTDIVPKGTGTFGSRAMAVGGTAILQASAKVKEQGAKIAAALLEVPPQQVVLESGRFYVEDVMEKSVTWADVAREAYDGRILPPEVERGLEATAFWEPPSLTFPYSAHVAVVNIDPDTGEVALSRYFSVDDCGTVINPMLVEGQIHGGLAQGIGQALLEEAVYDDQGQLISGSLMDYAVPFAEEFPSFTLDRTVTPTPNNPMGAKGIGEMATVAATPTIVGAVVDALSHLGVTHIDIPIRPEKVWRILHPEG